MANIRMTKDGQKKIMFPGFYMPEKMYDDIMKVCQNMGITQSEFARQALAEKLKRPYSMQPKKEVPSILKQAFWILDYMLDIVAKNTGKENPEITELYLDYENRLNLIFPTFGEMEHEANRACSILFNMGVETVVVRKNLLVKDSNRDYITSEFLAN